MDNFSFLNRQRSSLDGNRENVGEEILNYSKNILLHYGGGSIKKTGLYDRIIKSLDNAGIRYVELSGLSESPVKHGLRRNSAL